MVGPHGPHRREHFERIAQPVLERAAVRVGALVRERRNEARQQIAVRAVQFHPVEPGGGRPHGGRHELVAHRVHLGARDLPRRVTHPRQILLCGRTHQRPVGFGAVVGERPVFAIPRPPRGALGTAVPQLHGNARVGMLVYPVHDALPRLHLHVVPQPRTPRGDARLGAGSGHLGEHETGAPHGAGAKVHEMVIAGDAVHGGVLRHGRNDHAVLEQHRPGAIRREHGGHGRHRGGSRLRRHPGGTPGALGEPLLVPLEPGAVAQAQVLVTDALTAREHGVHELLRLELIAVARPARLEPLHGVPGRVLDAQRLHPPQLLELREHRGDPVRCVTVLPELPDQLDRVLERQLGARPDREVRGVHRVAHEHDVRAIGIAQPPVFAGDALKVEPRRPAQVPGVGHQPLALERFGKEPFAERDRRLLIGGVEAVRPPHRFGTFDDERGRLRVELVDVRLEPPVFGTPEVEGEGVEELVRTQPDEAIGAGDDVRLELLGVQGTRARVDPVGGDDEIGVGEGQIRVHLGLELELHSQRLASRLQNVEQPLASDSHESVPARPDATPLEAQLDVVPVAERLLDLLAGGRVPPPHVLHGGVGEDHTPAERVVRLVALHHRDVVRRIFLLHEQGEVQPRRPAANADDSHALCYDPLLQTSSNRAVRPPTVGAGVGITPASSRPASP